MILEKTRANRFLGSDFKMDFRKYVSKNDSPKPIFVQEHHLLLIPAGRMKNYFLSFKDIFLEESLWNFSQRSPF